MKKFVNFILRRGTLPGLVIVLPIAITLAILFWLFFKIGGILDTPLKHLKFTFPGIGLVLAFIFVTLVGFFGTTFVVRWVIAFAKWILQKIPFSESIYDTVKSLIGMFLPSSEKKKTSGEAARIKLADGTSKLGIVTMRDVPECFLSDNDESGMLTFWACQIGGEFRLVPKEIITLLPKLSADDVFKINMSGGVTPLDIKEVKGKPEETVTADNE